MSYGQSSSHFIPLHDFTTSINLRKKKKEQNPLKIEMPLANKIQIARGKEDNVESCHYAI